MFNQQYLISIDFNQKGLGLVFFFSNLLQQTQTMPSSHLPEICSLLAKILINSSTIALGGRRMSCQPHQGPNLPSEPWESSTLTSSCSGVSCQTILLMVLAFGGTEAMDVGSCIFAREAGQGESCKRNTKKNPSGTSGNILRGTKLGMGGGSVKPSGHTKNSCLG